MCACKRLHATTLYRYGSDFASTPLLGGVVSLSRVGEPAGDHFVSSAT